MNLTIKELIILIVAVSLIASLVTGIIKHSLRIVLTVAIIAFLFSGFTWLPEKVKEWTESGIEPEDINEVVDATKEGINDFIEKDKDGWIESAKSLWNKIVGEGNEDSGETPAEPGN